MIDQSLAKHLTSTDAERMRHFEVMFSSPGWKLLTEIFENRYNATKLATLAATTWPENRINTGKLQILGELLQLEAGFANEFEQIAMHRMAEQEQKEVEDAEFDYE